MQRITLVLVGLAFLAVSVGAQAPAGPVVPPPGTPIQQAPQSQAKLVVRVALVNTPVTVRDTKGQMVTNLDAKDF